jgi:phosphomannomutase
MPKFAVAMSLKMRALGYRFGGESLGHVLFSGEASPSYGIQAGSLFLKATTF